MRSIALSLISVLVFATEFPKTFGIAGDKVYENMYKYAQIKHLKIYQERPELLEAFCLDANKTMQKGFALDKMQEDMEAKVDKNMVKSYAKELRRLSSKNDQIYKQLQKDIFSLYEKGEFESLREIKEAGFTLNAKILKAVKEGEKREESEKPGQPAVLLAPSKMEPISSETETPAVEEPLAEAKKEAAEVPKERKPSELEYYQQSLVHLKDELYALRESEEQGQTACLNDITAINYWMIRVLENEKDPCVLSDAIKQMKSYDKSSATTCGRESMRYIEWHGRIKPYAGRRLYEAEAACRR